MALNRAQQKALFARLAEKRPKDTLNIIKAKPQNIKETENNLVITTNHLNQFKKGVERFLHSILRKYGIRTQLLLYVDISHKEVKSVFQWA